MLTFGHVHDLVYDALHSHFIQDAVMENANERTRVARILVQLDRHMGACVSCAGLDVDSEYSRIGAGLTNKELAGRRAFPDLLVHRRTVQTANVLAAEVKLRESSRPQAGPDRKDQVKIDIMTGHQHGLPAGMAPYEVGLCVTLRGNSAEGWWTVPTAGLWHEHEAFGSAPSLALMAAVHTIVWNPLDDQAQG